MAVGNVGARSLLLTKSLVSMRSQLGDLQRQLATGKRAETYAGIGLDRGLTVGLRSHLAAMKSYGDTITNVDVRLELSQSVLSRISELGHEVKAASSSSPRRRSARFWVFSTPSRATVICSRGSPRTHRRSRRSTISSMATARAQV
jgi:hypothetical protein